MRSVAVRLALAACLALVPSAAVVACTSFGEDAIASSTDAGHDTTSDAQDLPEAITFAQDGGCPEGAFCDSFNDAKGIPRGWSSFSEVPKGAAQLVASGGYGGTGGLVVTAIGADAGQHGFLTLVQGPRPASYDFVLTFRAKVGISKGEFLGPRFFSVNNAGLRRDVIVTFINGIAKVLVYESDCVSSCKTIDATNRMIGTDWHHYALTGRVHDGTNGDNGNVTLAIDGTDVVTTALPIVLSRSKTSGIEFGLTYAAAPAVGALVLDDVVLEITP